jgi:solute carrier family 39 (zinc transporter), member 11
LKNETLKERKTYKTTNNNDNDINYNNDKIKQFETNQRFRRIILLIIAVTVHNIPEGLAVGVGFGAIGKTKSATFYNARNLAIGIGIQNFPEGLAVSLPLYASGFSYWRSFWYGQLSGMVEPIAGILGVLAVEMAQT